MLMRRVSGMRSNWKWLASCLARQCGNGEVFWGKPPSSHPSVGKQRAGTVGCPTWWQLFVCQLVLFGRPCFGTQQTSCGDCGLFARIRIWVQAVVWHPFPIIWCRPGRDVSRNYLRWRFVCVQAAAHLMMRPIHVISDIADEAYSETIFHHHGPSPKQRGAFLWWWLAMWKAVTMKQLLRSTREAFVQLQQKKIEPRARRQERLGWIESKFWSLASCATWKQIEFECSPYPFRTHVGGSRGALNSILSFFRSGTKPCQNPGISLAQETIPKWRLFLVYA